VTLASRAIGAVLRADQAMIERREPRVEAPMDPSRYPWVADLEAAHPAVRAELDALLASGVTFPETSDVVGHDQGNEGPWTTFMLCTYGRWLEFNVARCPATTEVVRRVPGVTIAGFAVLHAGSHLPRHRGPSKSLRYHLGVKVPEPPGASRIAIGRGEHAWADGVSLVFDDAVEHEAWNDADEDRYVLFLEVLWPLTGVRDVLNRGAQRLLRLGARDVPRRAAELDAALNG
jgi:ornithine lipid ester-linked acyl 2-hydroxylase